jgi:CMP-N-acetylneuraminic acid synthetase
MICALLIGREGSSGFPGKNIYPTLGRPLIAYPLMAAQKAKYVDKIYISTDSPNLAAIAADFGAITINRPNYLCTNNALSEDAYQHGYKVIRDDLSVDGIELEALVLLYANSPTVTSATIDEGINILRKNPSYDSAVTVSSYNMWSPLRARRETEEGLLQPFVPFEAFGDPKSLNCDRDSQGDVWFADAGACIVRPQCLENMEDGLLPFKWMGKRIYPLKQWGGLDVDYEWQIPLVEYWLRSHGIKEPGST